jgi:hypothetical protein
VFYAADHLVPEDQRFFQGECADGAMLVVVQVRSADTAVGVADQDLTGSGLWLGQVVES